MKCRHILYTTMIILVSGAILGCEEILFETDLSDEKVVLIDPEANAELTETNINFSWDRVEGATGYELQISTPDFEQNSAFAVDSLITDIAFQTNLPTGKHSWRVRAVSGNSRTPFAESAFTITEAENFSDRKVFLQSPGDDLVTNQIAVLLTWREVLEATLYTIRILSEDGRTITETTTEDTKLTLEFPEGMSRWQVRAEKGSETTDFTESSIMIDVEQPNNPTLTLPVNNATFSSSDVTFEWTREAVAGSTEFDSIYIYRDAQLQDLEEKRPENSPALISLSSNTFYWQVRSFDQAGNSSSVSNTFSFTIN